MQHIYRPNHQTRKGAFVNVHPIVCLKLTDKICYILPKTDYIQQAYSESSRYFFERVQHIGAIVNGDEDNGAA